MNLAFYKFKDLDFVEQVHIFGLSNIHIYGSNISLIRLFSLIFNYAKPRLCSCLYVRQFRPQVCTVIEEIAPFTVLEQEPTVQEIMFNNIHPDARNISNLQFSL